MIYLYDIVEKQTMVTENRPVVARGYKVGREGDYKEIALFLCLIVVVVREEPIHTFKFIE